MVLPAAAAAAEKREKNKAKKRKQKLKKKAAAAAAGGGGDGKIPHYEKDDSFYHIYLFGGLVILNLSASTADHK